ncbi:MAG: thioredoxin-disulfide reductase [[Clostridium] spiroforme]|uniref:Thioredoxin reductase n=1 Tax=Thomasclavelia spiroformis TaxID=29348 RepID=A0A943I5B9_9FIRM|nr:MULTISPECIES: thioredoxin-disulfide reductase [Thomasclavelia]MBS5587320.1 thioredoxin-disulfide reductase [Thomasclavelia spiroformis]
MNDLIIIGAGPAGLSACLYASRAGLNVLMLDSGAPGGKLNVSAEIENWPGQKKKTGPELAYEMYEHALSFGGQQVFGEVTKIIDHEDYKEVVTTDNTYQAKAVLIATGTKERKMQIPMEDELTGHGVSYCAVCDGPFFKDEEVAVIGGGNSALEEAIYLTKFVNKVHLIVRRDVFRADKIIQNHVFDNEKIEIHFLKKPHHLIEKDGKVDKLALEDSKTGEISELAVKGVFPFVGLDPITNFVSKLGICDEQGYIITDETMKTKIPGIYAAGDVRQKILRQVVTAANDGAIAGQQIAHYLENKA